MKKLIISELLLLFLATTFMTDSLPPGWYQQTLPVNDVINDIFFLDSLTGWVCTAGASSSSDTGYIMKTTNGGDNWQVQFRPIMNFNSVQFLNSNTGYAGGGDGLAKFFKTTNGGINWLLGASFGFITITDLRFVNKDTGWICGDDPFAGIFKTINGGVNWSPQMSGSFSPKTLFFLNKDTGWAGSSDWKLYMTTNGGNNWNLRYTFTGSPISIFFVNALKGWVGGAGFSNIQYTTNGGFNWLVSQGEIGGGDIKFVNDSIGWAGGADQPLKIIKSIDGGKTWGYQNTPFNIYKSLSTIKYDTSLVWAGTFSLIHTIDGGGPITFTGIQQISNELPSDFKLFQNYPNPFNPRTLIKYQIVNSKEQISNVKLIVYDIQGREVTALVNEKQNSGTYQVDFDGSGLSSGVYFYKILITAGKEVFSDVKKMLMIK